MAQAPPLSNSSPTPNDASFKTPDLTATYTSPTSSPFTLSPSLPALTSTHTTTQKTTYLTALKKATADLQEGINKELTIRMEEDKKLASTAGTGSTNGKGPGAGKTDEAKEEDNYGEEVVEED